ncbi:hypothetical protein [Gordonia iterans]
MSTRHACRWCGSTYAADNYWRTCPDCLPREYADGENHSIEDTARRCQLDDRTALKTLVNSDGFELLVLASGPGGYKATTTPVHEDLGPLPDEIRAKIRRTRCGRMTSSGKPCRNIQSPCRYHR